MQVYLTIFYTYFHYSSDYSTTVQPDLSRSNIALTQFYDSYQTSITTIPHDSNILILAYPIHHLCNFIPSTPIPMTSSFNRMHSFYTKLPLTLNTRSITKNTPSVLSPTSPGDQLRAARRCISLGNFLDSSCTHCSTIFPSLSIHTKLIPAQS